MKRAYRRFLRALSLVVFIALAPVVILYALGYRVVSTTDPAATVGVVLIETVPRAAHIHVDGEYVGRSPESVAARDGERVAIEVAAEGYLPWQKTLRVSGGETVEIRDIRLFPAQPVDTVLLENVTGFTLSPDRTKVCAVSSGVELICSTLDASETAWRAALPNVPTELVWSADSQRLLVGFSDQTYAVAHYTTRSFATLPQLRGGELVRWDPRIATRLLFRNAAGVLLAYDTSNHAAEALADGIALFATSTRRIVTLSDTGTLSERTFSGTIVTQSQLPVSQPVQGLLVTPQGRIALHGARGDVWVRQDNGEYMQVVDSAAQIEWSPDGTHLALLTHDNGVSVANIDSDRSPIAQGQISLVQRLSTPIQVMKWFAGSRHLILQIGDELRITEIDARDHPDTYTVGGTNLDNAYVHVGEDGAALYFLRSTNGTTNLVRQALRAE